MRKEKKRNQRWSKSVPPHRRVTDVLRRSASSEEKKGQNLGVSFSSEKQFARALEFSPMIIFLFVISGKCFSSLPSFRSNALAETSAEK